MASDTPEEGTITESKQPDGTTMRMKTLVDGTKLRYASVFNNSKGKTVEIRDVWASNLDQEMAVIRNIVLKYPYVAMDTEFPGVVARPIGSFATSVDFHYQTLRCNVDLLKIIQLGVSFHDKDGNTPDECPCWQFNFNFSLNEDMYAQDSIELLQRSGISFKDHDNHGIDVLRFGELLMTSGLVLTEDVKWISFHSGYDFGYLLKVLTCLPLPADEAAFHAAFHTYFPCIYDIKHLVRKIDCLKGGLSKIADILDVKRVGPMHQAGSDALLTAATFFKLRKDYFANEYDQKLQGVLFGLGHDGDDDDDKK